MNNWASSVTFAQAPARATKLALVFALLTLVIAGCGPTPLPEPDTVNRVGVVLLSQADGAALPTGQAAFVRLTEPRSSDLLDNVLSGDVGTCVVAGQAAASAGPVAGTFGGTRLSVPSIALASNGSPFARLRQVEHGTFVLEEAGGPLPSTGLTLSVPAGGAFPAFNNVAVATGEPPELASGFDPNAIEVATEFRWTAGAAGAALLLIGSGNGVTFSCLADDAAGAFSFPEETRDALTAAGFSSGGLETLGRLSTSSVTDGASARLVVGTLRLASLGVAR